MRRKLKGVKDLTPAPGELRLVQAFVNTVDREAGTDELATPRALADWLARHGLLAPGTELDAADRQRARAVREGWRSLLAGSMTEESAEALDQATAAALLRARHGVDGVVRLEPAVAGLDAALGRLLVIVSRAQNDPGWQRLKVCASPSCRAIFYDRSPNHSARWCRPRCGNRASSKASKKRRRRAERQAHEAKRRALTLSRETYEPSLSALEGHPELGDLVRQVRESEKGK